MWADGGAGPRRRGGVGDRERRRRASSSIPRSPPTTSFATTTTRPRTRRRSRRCSSRPGFPRESFTHAIATHYEGVGMLAWRNDDGSWERFFPNAPILMSQTRARRDRRRACSPSEPIMPQLRAQGALQAVTDDPRAVDRRRVDRAHRRSHARPSDRARQLGRRAGGDRRPSRGERRCTSRPASARRSTWTPAARTPRSRSCSPRTPC